MKDKNGIGIGLYDTVWVEWGGTHTQGDILEINETESLVLIDLHDGTPTGFHPEEVDLVSSDLDTRMNMRNLVIERLQQASLPGSLRTLIATTRTHANAYHTATESTQMLFDTLERYIEEQERLYETLNKKQKRRLYPGVSPWLDIRQEIRLARLSLTLAGQPNGDTDDPD